MTKYPSGPIGSGGDVFVSRSVVGIRVFERGENPSEEHGEPNQERDQNEGYEHRGSDERKKNQEAVKGDESTELSRIANHGVELLLEHAFASKDKKVSHSRLWANSTVVLAIS